MAEYRISGVWKNTNDVITHYAFHKINENSTSRAKKTIKAEAIRILKKVEIVLQLGFGTIIFLDGLLAKM